MNEQLQQALTELITKATTGIDSASEFIISEMPEVIQQLLLWHGIRSLCVTCFGLMIGIVFIVCSIKLNKIKMGEYEDKKSDIDRLNKENVKESPDGHVPSYRIYSVDQWDYRLWFLLPLAGVVIVPITFSLTWLQIWIAPKVWLIEYAANLVK